MDEPSVLSSMCSPIQDILDRVDVTEVCLNRPKEVFVETDRGWEQFAVPALTYDWALAFSKAVGSHNDRSIGDDKTRLSAQLLGGERIFIIQPANCEAGTIAITIRKPSHVRKSHKELAQGGLYRRVKPSTEELQDFEVELLELHRLGKYQQFMEKAVLLERNIVASGATGSGKTTAVNAWIEFIPDNKRIISIEDVREIQLPFHANHVHLVYESDGSKSGSVTAKELLRNTLRMRPDRILIAELRGGETYDYLVNASSGHPGTMTTIHAESTHHAFEMMVMRIKESEEGKGISRADILSILYSTVDVICQFTTVSSTNGKERGISEIYYDPIRKRGILNRQNVLLSEPQHAT